MDAMKGGCHCGRIALTLYTAISQEQFSPRACDCTFCMKHGAQYISDRYGRLVLDMKEAGALGEHRFGHGLAKFLFCRHCGVFVAVVFESDGRTYGSVNSRCIDGAKFGDPQVISPQKLDAGQKAERWSQVMIPDVQINAPGPR